MLSSIPHIASKIISAVPPALKKGNEIPVFGIELVTTAMFNATCIITSAVIPVASKLPNISLAFIAISMPLHINSANNKITTTQPTKPSSSANIANMKSFCGSETYKYFCLLSPNPTPNNPPEPIAYRPCMVCQPVPVGSCQGSKKVSILPNLKLDSYAASPAVAKYTARAVPPIPPTIAPLAIKYNNLHPATIIITNVINAITIPTLKWF